MYLINKCIYVKKIKEYSDKIYENLFQKVCLHNLFWNKIISITLEIHAFNFPDFYSIFIRIIQLQKNPDF